MTRRRPPVRGDWTDAEVRRVTQKVAHRHLPALGVPEKDGLTEEGLTLAEAVFRRVRGADNYKPRKEQAKRAYCRCLTRALLESTYSQGCVMISRNYNAKES